MDFLYSQAIIIRKDLGMSKGKLAVQAAHASVGAYREISNEEFEDNDEVYDVIKREVELEDGWFYEGQRKIVFRADSEEHLQQLQELATSLNLPNYLVEDFGLTEFNGIKTKTALGVGPCKIEKLKAFTKDLELY